ncbi:MAG: DUF1343 domain-containing protein [Acidobacteria bacterium]|nr:DUF1343 domain-containing protein [Acidobacteriota bacterium]
MLQKAFKAYYSQLRAARILRVAMCLLLTAAAAGGDSSPEVLNGIDVLRRENFGPLAGKRVGLITNHTGLAADGTTTIDLLLQSGVCELIALFSPEHGIRGILDGRIDSSPDAVTGLPVYSLYGDTRKPTPEMLRRVEALIFDVQDIGARFYTYISTMAYCMEAAAEAKIPFYVLDRPNPVGGMQVEGPMLDADRVSFTGYMPLPIRHGMTVGELARYFNRQKAIGATLHVVAMQGWQRSFYYNDTGQLWVDPSPNMRSLAAAILYPGICLLERTNVSVGRGTERPFESVGAPWIEPRRLAAALREAQPPGVCFVPVYFTPKTGRYSGEKCGGVSVHIANREKVHSVLLGLTLVSVLSRLYPDVFELDAVMQLLGNAKAMRMLRAGASAAEVLETGRHEMTEFLAVRREALLYGPAE